MTITEWLDIFGNNLAEMMEDRDMTQSDLAHDSGISLGSINAYLHKQSLPGVRAIINIADALDVDISELIDFGDIIE